MARSRLSWAVVSPMEVVMRRSWLVLVVLAVFALLLTACGGDETEDATGATGATEGTAATGATAATGDECVDLTGEGPVFTITISDFTFEPNCFTASASQGISVVNEDDTAHTFTMTGTQVDVSIGAGETFNGEPISGVVEPGTYDFLCTIHPSMTGTVTVTA